MMATLKNSWKLFAVSATQSKARNLRNIRYFAFNNLQLRFFLIFSLALFATYTIIDVVTSPQIQSIGYRLFTDYSPTEILGFAQMNAFLLLQNSGVLSQIGIFLLITALAYVLTLIAIRPLHLVDIRRRYFTSNVAHELNTPLSILKSTAEVARMHGQALPPVEMEKLALSVIEEVDRMAQIVRYFLHYASPEQQSQLRMSPVNITSVSHKVGRKLATLAEQHGVSIEIPREGTEVVWGNFTALEEMLFCLTKNAIIYSDHGGTVRVSIKDAGNSVSLSVNNQGKGISSADLPYIFDAFYKGEGTVHTGQLGLGLTVAREIAKMHFAHIETFSSKISGTEFMVKLPK